LLLMDKERNIVYTFCLYLYFCHSGRSMAHSCFSHQK